MLTFSSFYGRATLLGLLALGFAAFADDEPYLARALSVCPTSEARFQFENGAAAYPDDGIVDAIVGRSRICDVSTRFILTADTSSLSEQRMAFIQGELVRRGVEANTIRTEVCPDAPHQGVVLITLFFLYSPSDTPLQAQCDRLAE